MDVREKLVELLSEKCMETCKQRKGYVCSVEECKRSKEKCCGFYADHVIAHGVTVQEWISAEEPPEEYRDEYGELIPFLVCEEDTDYPFRAMYDGKTWGDGIFAVPVKWWMHLPAPPKEKERKDGDGNV